MATRIEKPTREQVVALVEATGIDDPAGDIYGVCRQAILDGEGTPERVREIWAEATEDARLDREWDDRPWPARGPVGTR